MKDGTKVRITAEAVVTNAPNGEVFFSTGSRILVAGSDFSVEVLSEPLAPEPGIGSVVLDKVQRSWQMLDWNRTGMAKPWYLAGDTTSPLSWADLNENFGPLTVIHDAGNGATATPRPGAACMVPACGCSGEAHP